MAKEIKLTAENVERTEIERTTMIQIQTPRHDPNYGIFAQRELYITDSLGGSYQGATFSVSRRINDVNNETITVNNKEMKVWEIAAAISLLIDKWADEDKAIRNELNQNNP